MSSTRIDEAGGAAVDDGPGNVVVIGNFDGVHRGHRAVLGDAAERARAAGLGVCVLTFDPHPAIALGRTEPPRLSTLERRVELIAEAGVPRVFVKTFDRAFAATPPEDFVRGLLVERLRARVVEVGENFRFGKNAAGDRALLAELGAKHGFTATTRRLEGDARGPFSSSRARAAVAAGDLDEATHVLARPHELTGVVVRGNQLGRQLGWPTANLAPVAEMLPPDGVYAAWVTDVTESPARRVGMGALSIGVRPAVGEGLARTVEVFVLDAPTDLDLYDRRLRLSLVARLRGEQSFAGDDPLEALKAQIGRDVEEVRARLARAAAKR